LNAITFERPSAITKGSPRLLFATLMLGMMAQGLAFTAFVSALPQMAQELGTRGVFFAQMTMALAALGLMFGALASGWVLEKLGTRVTLLTSLLIYGLIGAGGLVLSSPPLLLATRFVAGFAVACMVTVCVWGIAAAFDGDERAKALGLSSSLANVSALTGTILGGYLAKVGGWHLPFAQYLVFGLAAFALAFVGIGQVRPEPDPVTRASQPYFKRLLPFYLLAALLFAVLFMASTQYAFLLQQNGVVDPATRSFILATVTVTGALMAFIYGPLQKLLSAQGTFLLGLACMVLALAATGWGLTAHPAFAVGCAVLMGVYAGLVLPYLYHSVTEKTDNLARSRAIGLLTAFGFLGGFLNPPVFLALANEIGLQNVFTVVSIGMLILAITTAVNLARKH
jgi:ACDE family multidrug resistance protein